MFKRKNYLTFIDTFAGLIDNAIQGLLKQQAMFRQNRIFS